MARKKKTENIKEETKVTKPKKSKRTMLTDTIQKLYFDKGYNNDDIPWTLLMSQVKQMEKDGSITDDDIRETISYMVMFEGKDISDVDTLGLVPYYIDKCKKYVLQYKENKKKAKGFVFEDITNKVVKHDNEIRLRKRHDTFD